MGVLKKVVQEVAKTLVHEVVDGLAAAETAIEAGSAPLPTLPQNDPDPAARAQRLAGARDEYVFAYDFAPPLPNVAKLPKKEEFTTEYTLGFVPTVAEIVSNQLEALDSFFQGHPHLKPDVTQIPELVKTWATGPHSFLNSAFFTETVRILLGGQRTSQTAVEGYGQLYKVLPAPPIVRIAADDWTFGHMRLAGFNPTVLQRIDTVPANFPVTDAIFSKVTGASSTLEAAGKDGRLYLCDYRLLDGIPGGLVHGIQKYATAPLALFYWQPGGLDGGSLMPVAIQLGQTPSEATPIFTPLDGIKWTIAKAFVQEADGDHHQAIAHLFNTHLRVEPVVVATFRELAATHPIHVLLAPHFEFTLAINNDARNELLIPGGVVDLLLGIPIEGSKQVIGRAYGEWRFDEANPDASFRIRGVEDAGLLPVYPYRDDTVLLWKAICGFVDRYVDLYYSGGQDMAADRELQAWAQCLVAGDGARLAGMSIRPNEPFTDPAYLKKVCSQIVYTASAQHAAVNYAQYPLMSYIPNCPLALFGAPPTSSSFEDERGYLDRLPPLSPSLWQMGVARLLSSKQPNQLCHYESRAFSDPRVAELLTSVKAELARAEQLILQRNNERRFPYERQLPSKVPNSILI